MANIHCDGEAVTKLRTQHGMTQEKLAAMSNVNIRTIQRAERGEHLQLENIASIAAALKVTVPALTMSDGGAAPVEPEGETEDRENNAVVLRPVASDKALLDIVLDSFSASLDCQAEPTSENIEVLTSVVEAIEQLLPDPWQNPHEQTPLTLAVRLRRAVELSAKLAELDRFGIAVFAGNYTARAKQPHFDDEIGQMVVRSRGPYEPVTICRVTLEMRKKERVVVMVTDKWQASTKADLDDDIPF